ncbi:transcription repressor OFP13-like [Lolium rigidum]|uniref:transcription repressor OFP13-like n=1 Tax=Lolium rigidum TaxID=89674 RepID=UPI001F5CD430|nr:transcription repressor OFP13-like [Lolium rigidum]
MGKKGAITAVFSRSKSNKSGVDSPPWPWPSCGDPQTDSFRAGGQPCASAASGSSMGSRCGPVAARHRKLVGAAGAAEMYKTVNSVYFDPDGGESCSGLKAGEDDGDEWVVVEDDGLPTATAACAEEDLSEAVIRSLSRTTLSTHRFFFDQDRPATNSILPAASSPAGTGSTPPEEEEEEEDKSAALSGKEKQPGPGDGGKSLVAEESVAVAVESANPHQDFLASMEEMVAAHGLRGWDALEELLVWYLRVNAKRHHPLIVSAFVDLLLRLTSTPSATSTTTTVTTSNSSTSTSSSASIGSSTSTSTSTTASTGSDVITAAAAAAAGQCGGGKEASASCSSSSSSCVPSGFGEAGRGEG